MARYTKTTDRQLEIIYALMGKVEAVAIAAISGASKDVVRYYHHRNNVALKSKPLKHPVKQKTTPRIDPRERDRLVAKIKKLAGTMPRQQLADKLNINLGQLIYYSSKLGVSLEYFGYNPVTKKTRYTKDQISKAKTLLNQGERYSEILKATGISDGSLWGIIRGDTHKNVKPLLLFEPDDYNPERLRAQYKQQCNRATLDKVFN